MTSKNSKRILISKKSLFINLLTQNEKNVNSLQEKRLRKEV